MEDKLNFRHQIADSVIIQLGSEKQISDIRRSDDAYFVVKIFSYMINKYDTPFINYHYLPMQTTSQPDV